MKFNCSCEYCKKNSFIWSIDKKLIWIEIPKNASYNVKTIKFKYDSEFPDDFSKTVLRRESSEDIKKYKRGIVILRNPVDRFKSLVSHYFVDGGRAKKGFGKRWLDYIGIQNYNESDLIDIVLNNFDKIQNIEEPHHFNSQLSFIPNNFFDLQIFFIDLNEVHLFFDLNTKVNSSNTSMFNLTIEQIEKIKKLYQDDVLIYEKYINN